MGKGFASTQCYRCNGYGHYAKECGAPAGTIERGRASGKGFTSAMEKVGRMARREEERASRVVRTEGRGL